MSTILELVEGHGRDQERETASASSSPVAVRSAPAYAQAALEGEICRVIEAPEHTRNDTLNVAAFSLGQLVAAGALDRGVVEHALTQAAHDSGLEVDETAATIRSGLTSGMQHPRNLAHTAGGGANAAAPGGAGVTSLEPPPVDDFDREVAVELHRLQVRAEAPKRMRAAGRAGEPAIVQTLGQALLAPHAAAYRVEGLIPADASTLIVAQRKAGKSTWALNLCRSLLSGDMFLGTLPVQPVDGTVAYLNFEVSGYTLASWAADLQIDADRLLLVNLRGKANPFDDEDAARDLADQLRALQVEAVVVDTFTRAFNGPDENVAGEVGSWLNRLAAWTRQEVGARDLILTAHAGWGDQTGRVRARGSSALEDWPDAIVHLTKADDGTRYMSAFGRDVDMSQDALAFDEATRSLSLTGTGSRAKASHEMAVEAKLGPVFDFILRNPGCSGNEIVKGVGGRNPDILGALRQEVESGIVVEERRPGRGGGKAYRVADEHHPTSPNISRGDLGTSPNLPYTGEVPGGSSETNLTPDREVA